MPGFYCPKNRIHPLERGHSRLREAEPIGGIQALSRFRRNCPAGAQVPVVTGPQGLEVTVVSVIHIAYAY